MSETYLVRPDGSGSGNVDLAVVTGVNATTFTAKARFISTGGVQPLTIASSTGFVEMPAEGSLCLVYRRGPLFCQYIKELNDYLPQSSNGSGTQTLPLTQLAQTGAYTGNVVMQPGEIFIGRAGYAFFNSSGDVNISSQSGNLSINLDDTTAIATVNGSNFTLSTQNNGIRVISSSSVPSTFGDSLRLEKNVPAPALPQRVTGIPPVVANLSYFELDALGGLSAGVVSGGELSIDELSNIEIGNYLGNMKIDALGDVSVFGDKNVGIEGLLSVSIDGNGPGFNVLINANLPGSQMGVARVDDLTLSSSASDPAFWAYMLELYNSVKQLYVALSTSPTTAGDGGAAYKAAIIASLATAPIPPAAVLEATSKIITGSESVTAGD